LPDWLPAPLQRYVLRAETWLAPDALESMRRFALDNRMIYVWRILQRRARSDTALTLYFNLAWAWARYSKINYIRTEKGCAALALEWTKTAAVLHYAKRHSDAYDGGNPQLAQALRMAAKYCKKLADKERQPNPLLMVKQYGRDDDARAYVRLLSYLARGLFDSPLFGTVAKTASVALDRPITWQQVRDWTKSLPNLPL
jgi:hypothetical protein